MKFLCDRCKTRYSIADERVRGKILKIRCKNCANVITVREGMEEAVELKTPVPVRSGQRAAIAPGAGLAGKPLEAAFANAMSSPGITVPPAAPAALEEEWYVSIDGDQSGPFALAQAQGWVAGRGADEDLYCWSEGFDDWLPVEKVSHFRGLRGRTRPRTEPPPMPTDSGRYLRPGPEPDQPLFAATLAALEAEAPTSIGSPPLKLDDLMPARQPPKADARNGGRPATPAPAIPTLPANGRATLPKPLPTPTSVPRAGAPPLPGTGPVKSPSGPTMSAASSTGLARVATPAGSATPSPASAPSSSPVSSMFSKGPAPANGANGANGHEARAESRPMFDDAGISDDGDDANDALSRGAARGGAPDLDDENDDLAIGEVSRVVRIADLAKPSMQAPVPRRTPQASAVARGTGAVPKFEQAALAASGDALAQMPMPQPLTGTESELVQQLAQAPPPPRHTLMLAMGVGFVALIATLVIVFAARGGEDDPDSGPSIDPGEGDLEGIGMQVTVITMAPPPDTTGQNPGSNQTGSGGKPSGNTGRPSGNNGNTGRPSGNNGGNGKVEVGGLTALSGDDVVAMSQKMSTGPRRCYEQAKRKDPFLDVKRLRAVITVDKVGTVTRVELIDHANSHLDTCLSGAISRWKFRANSEGLTSQVSFAFMSS